MAYQNFFAAKLQNDIGAADTTITLDTAPSATSGRMVLEARNPTQREIVKYTGVAGLQLTGVTRGQGGTSAKPHTKNSLVEMNLTAEDLDDAINVPNTLTQKIKDTTFDFVASGIVWSGDSYGGSRAASMTAGVVYINGARYALSAVTGRVFTASRDTYVDVNDSGVIVYTEVTNNAASPALLANSIRLAIIVTGASNILNAGSVNQGQLDKVLPIVSSVPYTFTDSLGNIINPRDPNRKIIGYRQIITGSVTSSGTSETQITGLSSRVQIPTGRKAKATLTVPWTRPVNAFGDNALSIWNGTPGSGTQIKRSQWTPSTTGSTKTPTPPVIGLYDSTGAASDTFNAAVWNDNTGTSQTIIEGLTAFSPASLLIELV